MNDEFYFENIDKNSVKIMVAGVGGFGLNAINYILRNKVDVEFIAYDTNFKNLKRDLFDCQKVRLENELEAVKEKIKKSLLNVDIVFIFAGMGGKTGSFYAPIIAEVAKEENKFVIAIVTKPFEFEGPEKMELALSGIEKLRKYADTITVISNQKIFNLKSYTPYIEVHKYLIKCIEIVKNIITNNNNIVDLSLNDLKSIASTRNSGNAIFGYGVTSENCDNINEFINKVIENPILEREKRDLKKFVLVNFSLSKDIYSSKFEEVLEQLKKNIGIKDDEFILSIQLNDEKKIKIYIIIIIIDNTYNIEIVEDIYNRKKILDYYFF